MDSDVTKLGNGIDQKPEAKNGTGIKNRLRILGTAVLERENQPNLRASYDYTTSCANEFFEEDVDQLKFFELNKIALGMTIHKKEPDLKLANGHGNGLENGHAKTAMKTFTGGNNNERYLTDVIWSHMDMAHPNSNPNAYIIKQYYANGGIHRKEAMDSHSESYNNFLCGFLSCLAIIVFLWFAYIKFPSHYDF